MSERRENTDLAQNYYVSFHVQTNKQTKKDCKEIS